MTIDKQNSYYGFDHDGKFCDVWCLMKQTYPHIKCMEDIASATLKLTLAHIMHEKLGSFGTANKQNVRSN